MKITEAMAQQMAAGVAHAKSCKKSFFECQTCQNHQAWCDTLPPLTLSILLSDGVQTGPKATS